MSADKGPSARQNAVAQLRNARNATPTRADTGNLFCKDISAAQEKYPCSDKNGTTFFQSLIALEDPDAFVFTGDSVCSGDIFGGKNALDGLLKDFVAASNTVPWLLVEGCVVSRALPPPVALVANRPPPRGPCRNHDGARARARASIASVPAHAANITPPRQARVV